MKKSFSLFSLFLLGACQFAEAPSPLTPIHKEQQNESTKTTEEVLRYVMTPSTSNIRVSPSSKAEMLGQTIPSGRFPVYEERKIPESGCKKEWLRVQHNGWICSDLVKETFYGEEFEDHQENKYPGQKAIVAKTTAIYEGLQGKKTGVREKGAELDVIRITRVDETNYAQVNATEFVKADDLTFQGKGMTRSAMRGVELTGNTNWPYLFYSTDSTPIYDGPGKGKRSVGHKVRYQREPALQTVEQDGHTYYRVEGGWIQRPEKGIAVIEPEPLPDGISEHQRWVRVRLSDQSLIAYEGSTPMYATMGSSGKLERKGAFWTVSGSFRIQRKFRHKSMQGSPFGESYLVEEVPWPQFFFETYALHGAFWHNNFGRIASHGCFNLAPPDAFWLSEFLQPNIPPGWSMIFPPLSMETSVVVVRL